MSVDIDEIVGIICGLVLGALLVLLMTGVI